MKESSITKDALNIKETANILIMLLKLLIISADLNNKYEDNINIIKIKIFSNSVLFLDIHIELINNHRVKTLKTIVNFSFLNPIKKFL